MKHRIVGDALLVLVVGCTAGSADRATARVDSVPPPPPAAAPAPAPELVSLPAPGDSTRRDSTVSPTPVATPAELDQLRRALIVPVQGVARSDLHDTYTEPRAGHSHEALDILAPRGTPVVSAADGRVLKLFTSVEGGLMIYAAESTNRFILLYGHLDRYADGLVAGAVLRQGEVIGFVGTTGNAPANTPHLHFAVERGRPDVAWWKGVAVNPYPLLAIPTP